MRGAHPGILCAPAVPPPALPHAYRAAASRLPTPPPPPPPPPSPFCSPPDQRSLPPGAGSCFPERRLHRVRLSRPPPPPDPASPTAGAASSGFFGRRSRLHRIRRPQEPPPSDPVSPTTTDTKRGSHNMDLVLPVTATRFAICHLGLKTKIRWYPWYSAGQYGRGDPMEVPINLLPPKTSTGTDGQRQAKYVACGGRHTLAIATWIEAQD